MEKESNNKAMDEKIITKEKLTITDEEAKEARPNIFPQSKGR